MKRELKTDTETSRSYSLGEKERHRQGVEDEGVIKAGMGTEGTGQKQRGSGRVGQL